MTRGVPWDSLVSIASDTTPSLRVAHLPDLEPRQGLRARASGTVAGVSIM
jgi:hypothetical protein